MFKSIWPLFWQHDEKIFLLDVLGAVYRQRTKFASQKLPPDLSDLKWIANQLRSYSNHNSDSIVVQTLSFIDIVALFTDQQN